MDALNRHLKSLSETRVECARVVERGKGSGSGGGVLGDLDNGLATDWWRWCRYFVWGDILINANLTQLRERENLKVISFSFLFLFCFVTYLRL